jgi:hypothetical protein
VTHQRALSRLAAKLLPPVDAPWASARETLIHVLLDPNSSTASRMLAWGNYQDAAETAIDALDNSNREQALIGLILDKARIWSRASYQHQAMLQFVSAEIYARNLGDINLLLAISQYTAVPEWPAVEAEVEDCFDDALNLYLAIAETALPELDLAHILLGQAYCYRGLIDEGGDAGKLGPQLQAAATASLKHFDGHRQQDEAIRLLMDTQHT